MNILMLTSVYPLPNDHDKSATKVVNYFVNEWVKQGHNVFVIHNVHRYFRFIHCLPQKVKSFISTRIGFNIPDLYDVAPRQINLNGAKVFRCPIKKNKPHSDPSQKALDKQAKLICKILANERFEPDLIMGHWASPQAGLIVRLKRVYNCKTSIVLHGQGYCDKPTIKEYLSYIDKIGCRSVTESNTITSLLSLKVKPFVCYSGIPSTFIEQHSFNGDKFNSIKSNCRFVYAGRLVKYKSIDKVLIALSSLTFNYSFDIIGEGPEKDALMSLAKKLGIENKVFFRGKLSREETIRIMNESHVFIMISKGEVFGLVYLESMSSSCLTIGSRGEGIDGVIVDSFNGFLSEAASSECLLEVLQKISEMSFDEIKKIAANGYDTAKKYSDYEVAKDYLMKAY